MCTIPANNSYERVLYTINVGDHQVKSVHIRTWNLVDTHIKIQVVAPSQEAIIHALDSWIYLQRRLSSLQLQSFRMAAIPLGRFLCKARLKQS